MNKKKDNSWKKQIGCGYLIAIIYVVMMLVGFSSCSPRIIENTIIQHDTTRVVKVDSIWKYEKDSVFVKEKGDTIYKYVEKIRYRDRYKVDTLVRVKVDSVTVERIKEVKVEKPLSWWESFKMGMFWWLFALCAGLLVWTFRKPIIKLIGI
jgi:hypothetical protein